MKTSELLRNAGKAVELFGLTKGEYATVGKGDVPCGVCTLGSVRLAANGWTPDAPDDFDVFSAAIDWNTESQRAEIELENALRELEPDQQVFYIPSWNDREERTKEDVLALIERAATRAEEAGD